MQSVSVSGGAATEDIISGLTCDTTYTIEVAAVNSAGIGKYSLSMTASTSSKSVCTSQLAWIRFIHLLFAPCTS